MEDAVAEQVASLTLDSDDASPGDDAQAAEAASTNALQDRLVGFYCSQTFGRMEAIPAIATALTLMQPPSVHPDVEGRPAYLLASESGVHYSSVAKSFQINWERFPQRSAKAFYLLRRLGYGLDGFCWLACSTSGSVCAIKMFWNNSSDEAAVHVMQRCERERTVWNTVMPNSSFIVTLISRPALVMPWLVTHEDKHNSPVFRNAVRAAVEELANSHFHHKDLENHAWRHVGYIVDNDSVRALLLDHSHTETIEPTKVADAKKDMLRRFELGPAREHQKDEDEIKAKAALSKQRARPGNTATPVKRRPATTRQAPSTPSRRSAYL